MPDVLQGGVWTHFPDTISWEVVVFRVVDEAHENNHGGDHREGFCKACSDALMVAQRAVPVVNPDDHYREWLTIGEPQPGDRVRVTGDDGYSSFEVPE